MENKKITFAFRLDVMLFIIFLILKLDGIIQWKWLWVFAPMWVMWIIQFCCVAVVFITNAIKNFNLKCDIARARVSGPSLVWDAKTSTLYGPWNNEEEN